MGGYLKDYVTTMRRQADLARENSGNGLILYEKWADYDREIAEAVGAADGLG